jgi:hypothetical protein
VKSFLENISIFWNESAKMIGIFSVYTVIVCYIIGFVEFYNQTSNVILTDVLIKSGVMALLIVVCCSIMLFILGWYSDLFGGELLTVIILPSVGLFLIYKVNLILIHRFGIGFENLSHYAFLHLILLILPILVGFIFILILSNAFKNN